MRNHFRTAVLTIILTGGTMLSYATAYVMMDQPAAPAAVSSPVAAGVGPAMAVPGSEGRTDISVRAACAVSGSRAERTRCMLASTPQPTVRVIDMAASQGDTQIH